MSPGRELECRIPGLWFMIPIFHIYIYIYIYDSYYDSYMQDSWIMVYIFRIPRFNQGAGFLDYVSLFSLVFLGILLSKAK